MSKEITFRKANINDLKAIQKLNQLLVNEEQALYDSALDLNWTFGKEGTKIFTNHLTQTDKCAFLAESGKNIIGYITGSVHAKYPYSYRKIGALGEINTMYILNDYRSQHIGTELIKLFFHWCKEKNVQKIKVEATAQNNEAISFYKKNGFKEYTIWLETNLTK